MGTKYNYNYKVSSIDYLQKQPFADVFQNRCFKNFAIFTGQNLCWSLFLIKDPGLPAYYFIKKRLQHKTFPVNIAKTLRTSSFIEHLRCLLLYLKLIYLIGRKKSTKNDKFFCQWRIFLPTIFFLFDRRLIFTDKYFYQHFFYRREQLVFFNLKITLLYHFNFKFDTKF